MFYVIQCFRLGCAASLIAFGAEGPVVDELIAVLNDKTRVIRSVRANAQPIIMPAASAPVSTKALAVPQKELERRAARIQGDTEFQERVGVAMSRRFEGKESPAHIEQRIYDGFPLGPDSVLMEKFHTVPWLARFDIAEQLQDDRMSEFSRRLIYVEHPQSLSKSEKDRLKEWALNRVTTTDDVPWTTIPKALSEIEELAKIVSDAQKGQLSQIKIYIEGIADQIKNS